MSVGVGGAACILESFTYTEIVCVTQQSGAMTDTLTVSVTNSFDTVFPADCTGSCDFEFSAAATPTLTSVDKPEVIMSLPILNQPITV